jgi:hypothetical protein
MIFQCKSPYLLCFSDEPDHRSNILIISLDQPPGFPKKLQLNLPLNQKYTAAVKLLQQFEFKRSISHDGAGYTKTNRSLLHRCVVS